MLEGRALDQFIDSFWGEGQSDSVSDSTTSGKKLSGRLSGTAFSGKAYEKEESELEEYELKEDGIIIQPIHKGKVEKRTWIGLLMFLTFVPFILYILVHQFHGRHDVAISLLVLSYSLVPFIMVFEGRHPQARESSSGSGREKCIFYDRQF